MVTELQAADMRSFSGYMLASHFVSGLVQSRTLREDWTAWEMSLCESVYMVNDNVLIDLAYCSLL
jgi:hypothetical protein